MIKDRSEPLNYREHKQNLTNTLKTLISIALIFLFSENPSVKKNYKIIIKKSDQIGIPVMTVKIFLKNSRDSLNP